MNNDPIVKCECCGTECHVRGGQHRGATNWYEPVKPKPPFKDALRGFTHCPMCGKEVVPWECPICKKEFIRGTENIGMSCLVLHGEGTCCHFHDKPMVRKGEGHE